MSAYQVRDILERLFWTFVATFLGALTAAPLLGLNVTAIQSAAVAGLGAVATGLLAVARWRLSVLPNPGQAVAENSAFRAYQHIDANDR